MWLVQLRLLQGASAVVGIITPPPPLGLPDLSIGNFYVMDMRIKRRRPITIEEFELVKQWQGIYKRVKLRYARDMSFNRGLQRAFEAQLRGQGVRHESGVEQGIKLPLGSDPSGLRPRIRADAGRQNGARGPGATVLHRPRVRGRHRRGAQK